MDRCEGMHQWTQAIRALKLGEYLFGEGAKVLHGASIPSKHIESTELHETCHLHLCATTSFGRFQDLLGYNCTHKLIPGSFKYASSMALRHCVDKSWRTHEGYATISEWCLHLVEGGWEQADGFFANLPENDADGRYKSACGPLVHLLALLQLPLWPLFGPTICEAVGSAALATDILTHMRDPRTFLQTDWTRYLSATENNPDARLSKMLLQAKDNELCRTLGAEPAELLGESIPHSSVEEFVAIHTTLPLEQKVNLFDTVYEHTVRFLQSAVPFNVVDNDQRHEQLFLLKEEWVEYLRGCGVPCEPPTRQPVLEGIDEKLQFYLDKLDHVPTDVRFPDGVGLRDFADVLVLLKETRSSGQPLFARVLYNPSDHPICGSHGDGQDPFAVPPLGLLCYLHAVDPAASHWQYTCPLRGVSDELKEGTCTAVAGSPDVEEFLRVLDQVTHVKLIDETFGKILLQRAKRADVQMKAPWVVLADGQSPRHWNDLLSEAITEGTPWFYFGPMGNSHDPTGAFLVLGCEECTRVFARPASLVLVESLRRMNPEIRFFDDLMHAPNASHQWRDLLSVACHHYWKMGW